MKRILIILIILLVVANFLSKGQTVKAENVAGEPHAMEIPFFVP
jgi:hypothetical protein